MMIMMIMVIDNNCNECSLYDFVFTVVVSFVKCLCKQERDQN